MGDQCVALIILGDHQGLTAGCGTSARRSQDTWHEGEVDHPTARRLLWGGFSGAWLWRWGAAPAPVPTSRIALRLLGWRKKHRIVQGMERFSGWLKPRLRTVEEGVTDGCSLAGTFPTGLMRAAGTSCAGSGHACGLPRTGRWLSPRRPLQSHACDQVFSRRSQPYRQLKPRRSR